jgi:hypothetical protein
MGKVVDSCNSLKTEGFNKITDKVRLHLKELGHQMD